jgi:hypothetical protein
MTLFIRKAELTVEMTEETAGDPNVAGLIASFALVSCVAPKATFPTPEGEDIDDRLTKPAIITAIGHPKLVDTTFVRRLPPIFVDIGEELKFHGAMKVAYGLDFGARLKYALQICYDVVPRGERYDPPLGPCFETPISG